jgi:prophage regulatory protein
MERVRLKPRHGKFKKKPVGPNWEKRLLRASELATLLGDVHIMTIWRWVKVGKLPKPIRLSPRAVAWRGADIAAWIAEQRESAA